MSTDVSQTRGHETVLDVTAEQLAKVYAQAFLAAAGSSADPAEGVAQLKAIVSEVLDKHPDFAEATRSAFLSHDERVALIDRVLGGRVDPVVLNTLKVMSSHDRLDLLRTVARQADDLHNTASGRVKVEVTTAQPLTGDLQAELENTLRSRLGVEPMLAAAVDPDMIAGLKVRIRDTVYDGSLRTIFAKARQSIVDRAIERIEQNPAHFLNGSGETPDGNPPDGDA